MGETALPAWLGVKTTFKSRNRSNRQTRTEVRTKPENHVRQPLLALLVSSEELREFQSRMNAIALHMQMNTQCHNGENGLFQ